MSKETIGKKIKAFRKSRGLTQAKLARDLGYSHKSVITQFELLKKAEFRLGQMD